MNELRPAIKLYIAALSLAALGLLLVTVPTARLPEGWTAALALVLTGLMALASLFPLPLGFKTKIYLDTSVIFAALLLLEPGVAAVVVAAGVVIADLVRHRPGDETLFNTAQYVLQTGLSGLLLSVGGWNPDTLSHVGIGDGVVIVAAGVTMYAINTLAVGTIVGIQAGLAPLTFWRRAVAGLDRTDFLATVAQLGIGLLAAALVD